MTKVRNMGIAPISFLAGEDLSDYQYHWVELQDAGYVHLADSGASLYAPIGILQNAPEQYEEALVQIYGNSKLVMDSTGASYGALVTTDGSAHGSATTTASLGNAVALEVSDLAASSIIEVLLLPGRSGLARLV